MGGKSGVAVDLSEYESPERGIIVRRFIRTIISELLSGVYIPAPDMGCGEREMAIIYGETHKPESVKGKPVSIGGMPGRREATGRGVATATRQAVKCYLEKELDEVRIAVQGAGNVDPSTCIFLHRWGAKVVAVTDLKGGVYEPGGIDIPELERYIDTHGTVAGFSSNSISNEQLFALEDIDVLIPAACEDQITEEIAPTVRAPLVVEGANGPTTREGDKILTERGIKIVPDILANAGGVIASYTEWRQAKSGSLTDISETYETIDNLIVRQFDQMCKLAEQYRVTNRVAALYMAVIEVLRVMEARGII